MMMAQKNEYSNLRKIGRFYLVSGNLTDSVCQIENDNLCLNIVNSVDDIDHEPRTSVLGKGATPLPQLENLEEPTKNKDNTNCGYAVATIGEFMLSALFARQGFVAGKSERVDCRV